MSKKFTVLLLGAFLLLQCYQRIEANSDEEEDQGPYVQLLLNVVRDTLPISRDSITKGVYLFKGVLKELSVLKAPSEALQTRLTEISDFVTGVEKHAEKKEYHELDAQAYDLAVKFWNIVEKYDTEELEHPTIEDLLIELSLYKNGYAKIEAEFEQNFKTFVVDCELQQIHLPNS